MAFYEYGYFRPSKPRAAKGGIKAQSKRGAFGTSWWAKRWIGVLDSFNIGARLSRGRSYARNGQVLNIAVKEGMVTAKVQGSRPTPYAVTICVKELTAAEWTKVTTALSGQALYLAKLLAGEMPPDIETVFQQAGLSLFPAKLGDLTTDCSCPDYSNPCKHIAAVYYLLGEEFDRDPFLIFQLRGLGRDKLLAKLGGTGKTTKAGKAAKTQPVAVEPLPAGSDFWSAAPLPEGLFDDVRPPTVSAAWPRRLGNFPFWRGEEGFLDALTPVYRQAAERGLTTFLGEKKGE